MKLRVMHVKPDGVNRTWDVLLLDDRQNARIHLNPEGSEFMDIVILEGGKYTPARDPLQVRDISLYLPLDNVLK